MRVLEPHHFERSAKKRKALPFTKRLLRAGLLAVLLLTAGYVVFGQKVGAPSHKNDEGNASISVQAPHKVLKQFTAEQFKALYNSHIYPNTEPIDTPPSITGNEKADARIRKLAEKRGYKLTATPVASIVHTEEPRLEDNDLLQPNALIAWQDLKAAATKDGITLTMTSAYRSIEFQRQLFLGRLQAAGVNVGRILEGYADDEIDAVLSRAAIPGYSRHHTGYTIDLSCNGVGLENFINTTCYKWLSKNNFENVKKAGWVPSYPEGVGGTGPEPESWEFIWVGTRATYE